MCNAVVPCEHPKVTLPISMDIIAESQHFIDAAEDPLMPWAFFRNDVTMDKIQHRFMKYANFYGKKSRDMAYYTQESVLFEIPATDFPIPLPYLLTYKEIQLSGVLK